MVRASITKLESRVAALESKTPLNQTDLLALQRLSQKLEALDAEHRSHHLALIDVIEDDALEAEQRVLDEHDDRATDLSTRIRRLLDPPAEPRPAPAHVSASQLLQRRLKRAESNTTLIAGAAKESCAKPEVDFCLLRQYEEQLGGIKLELSDISRGILSLDHEDPDLLEKESALSKVVFDACLSIKRALTTKKGSTTTGPLEEGNVKLPKLDVPTFDGHITSWRSFWEQFRVSVHDQTKLSGAEKLAYLRHALKGGSARFTIEGLSSSGDNYAEAVDCLLKRYDRPRLLHQAHVRAILEAPPLKDGSGRELRKLHDIVNQHLRALKAMKYDPPGHFVTSVVELKLDQNTMFEWQKYSQEATGVPHYGDMLNFLNLRAQASESSHETGHKRQPDGKRPPIFTSYYSSDNETCAACKGGKHPLYACQTFKAMSHDKMMTVVRGNALCRNCLRPGHFAKQCPSSQRCKRCQKPHHSLLHIEPPPENQEKQQPNEQPKAHMSHVTRTTTVQHHVLLMTCRVLASGLDGSTTQARALLDSASSTSFVTEHLAQLLCLPRSRQVARIAGIGGMSCSSQHHPIVRFTVARVDSTGESFGVKAMVLPKVTSELPTQPVPFSRQWHHLLGLQLADPDFGKPGNIDVLLGADVFCNVMRYGRRQGGPGAPSAFETAFGWVLAGATSQEQPREQVISCHATELAGDDLLRRFWEVEEHNCDQPILSRDEKYVVDHFRDNHYHDETGRFVVPLPKKSSTGPLGESRSQAVRRFHTLERSLRAKGQFAEFAETIDEYFQKNHAELVPTADLERPCEEVFYMPMHAVVKSSSTTTRIRAVFDASARSSTGISLNDQLHVGPTVHSSLIDVLLRFRLNRIALTTDVSRMYRAVALHFPERDLHRFVWRENPNDTLKDFRMTRLTFGVAASSFAANMAVRQNAEDHALDYPLARSAVQQSFYVDDGLVGADSLEEARELQCQLQELFAQGGFLLRKWKSSDPDAIRHLSPSLLDEEHCQNVSNSDGFAKALGIEWNATMDCFRTAFTDFPEPSVLTKRILISSISKIFDVMGWHAPVVVKVKNLFQQLWEAKIGWDEPVPTAVEMTWKRWKEQLPSLVANLIPRCYFPRNARIVVTQLHGFCDASEVAYAGVAYLRLEDTESIVHTSLVIAKTKVAPIKRLTIPRLELCGAMLLASLLQHVKRVLEIPPDNVFAWTDSLVVLGWLRGDPRRFKTFVGNRVSQIMDLVPPDRWSHVRSAHNPADCASRGLFPHELAQHQLWWKGPEWLCEPKSDWPTKVDILNVEGSEEEKAEVSLVVTQSALPLLSKVSSFNRLKRITAWMYRFVNNCRPRQHTRRGHLSTLELNAAEEYWLKVMQGEMFGEELSLLQDGKELPRKSKLLSLRPFVDAQGLLRVGGRASLSKLSYSRRHPIILPSDHVLTKLIVHSEHLRLLHAGPTLTSASLTHRFHIVSSRKVVRSVTRRCVVCRRDSAKPQAQMLGQLPSERVSPGSVFQCVGVDYAGPILTKRGATRKPILDKSYVCVFVSLAVKAVHLEVVSDLTTAAFIATLRRFISRRGKPSSIWSDHGSNFIGSARELKELHEFLSDLKTQRDISEFCTLQSIQWKFIPERAPHFGGLWEATVKSFKTHLRRIVGDKKLTYEELSTVLSQIEACLNSRPLMPLPEPGDAIEALTPGHFLIGGPLEALPDPQLSYRSIPLLRRWHLCQAVVRHLWQRWSSEYLQCFQKLTKWKYPSRNLQEGDLVCVREDNLVPTKWPLARVKSIHPGEDGLVRVVTLRTPHGDFKRPITKTILILPVEQ